MRLSFRRIAEPAARSLLLLVACAGVIAAAATFSYAAERQLLRLKNFVDVETKASGFVLPSETRIHIRALGCGADRAGKFSDNPMCAYAWIINADTRKEVWAMNIGNTRREKDDRLFDDTVSLPKGIYEVYYSAYAYYSRSSLFSYNINIDRRKNASGSESQHRRGLLTWLEDLFTGDMKTEWKKHAEQWGVEIFLPSNAPKISVYTPPKDLPHMLFHAVKLGEDEHIRQGFTIKAPMSIRVYAIGERSAESEPADYGWIIDARTRQRVWSMEKEDLSPAGGAEKNVKFDGTIRLEPGEYILYYTTDDSHSFVDWNAAPPVDPYNYGVTLMATSEEDKDKFELTTPSEDKNIVIQLTQVRNNETRTASFALKKEARLHIYAIGERGNSRRDMADYGWIINAKTREKVWEMDVDRTEHAGGAEKNRMVDEIITLPRGTYTACYQTDDTHAYGDWDASPPFDPEHYGLTISLEGEPLSAAIVERDVTPAEEGIIAQIVRVGDNANKTQSFHLEKPSHVRIYAIGEGQGHDMFDYGWIEKSATHEVVWEMSYSMTFHAGGARKNRIVNTTILLDRGEYILHYVSDDSHSFDNWNADPPDDPTMWGITLYNEK